MPGARAAWHFLLVGRYVRFQNYGNPVTLGDTMSASQKSAAPVAAAGASSAALTVPTGKGKATKSQVKSKRKKKSWSSSPQWCKEIATLQIARATPEMKRWLLVLLFCKDVALVYFP